MQSADLAGDVITQRDSAEVKAEFIDAWRRLYDRCAVIERCKRYYLAMRPTRSRASLWLLRQTK